MRNLALIMSAAILLPAWPAAAQSAAPSTRPADVRKNVSQVWLSSLEPNSDDAAAVELRQAVTRLEAATAALKTPNAGRTSVIAPPIAPVIVPDPIVAPNPAPATDPVVRRSPATGPASGPDPTATVTPASQPSVLPAAELARLRNLFSKDPISSARMGQALMDAGNFEDAFAFLEQALKNTADADDQAWLLLQMATCKHRAEPVAAAALYKRVVAEHAASNWAIVAAAQDKVLEFYQTNGPQLQAVFSAASQPASAPAASSQPTTQAVAASS